MIHFLLFFIFVFCQDIYGEGRALPEDERNNHFEKIQVTGSRIKRVDLQGASPLVVVDRETIENSGFNSISDVLREVTINSFGGLREQQLSSISGVAHSNLRGLGAERTLVLLNGKRLAADPINRAVDLNLIPMAAVERVEILTDGGSALYGSDALGGVINIITRKDFIGTQVSLQQTLTELGGGEKTHATLTSGHSTSRLNVIGVLSYRNNRELMGDDRIWTKKRISTRGSPGSLGKRINGKTTYQPATDCPKERIDEDGYCSYNYGPHNTIRPRIEQSGLLFEADYSLTSNMTTYLRVLGTRKMTYFQYPPNYGDFVFPMTDFSDLRGADGKQLLNSSEISPGNQIVFRQRLVELGPRLSEIATNAYSALLGLRGYLSFTETWQWDFSISHNHVHRFDERVGGFILKESVNEAIRSGEYKPQAADGKRGDLSRYRYVPHQEDNSQISQAELTFTGNLPDFFNRPLGMSFGVVANYELFKTRMDEVTQQGLVLNKGGLDGDGNRETISSYLEFGFSLTDRFEWQLAARYDVYSDFGETFNPKIAFRWVPLTDWMVRGSVSTGFMAPRIQDLYSKKTDGVQSVIDHVLCDQKGGKYCVPSTVPVLRRGNPELEEEISFHVNLGTGYQVYSNLNFILDSWYLLLENGIGSNWSNMTRAEARWGGDSLRNRGINIQRDPENKEITLIDAPFKNLFSRELMGLDFRISWEERTKWGLFDVQLAHSHMLYYKEENFIGLGHEDQLGKFGKPEWRRQMSVTYSPNENHQIYTRVRTVGPSEKLTGGTLKTYSVYDGQYRYKASWNGAFTFGVRNLFGSTPPLSETKSGNLILNTSLYDNLGRYLYFTYSQDF